MKSLLIFIYLFTIIGFAQEETLSNQNQEGSIFQIKDSPNKASLFYNIKLSDKFTFQNGLSIRKNFDFNTFEIPILLKYGISDKWSTVFGIQTRTIINSNYPELFNNFEKPSNSYLSIGTEYKFKNEAIGNFNVGFPFDFQFSLKF
jgi:hypothetical protein|tara:strand:+ start:1524 stop:1961 length:438 start_codon:yes stop_codon:yes gene_type:complete